MNLQMNSTLADAYIGKTQRVRIITEEWVNKNVYCPFCGCSSVTHFENNRPVADFFCPHCAEEYELKSKKDKLGSKVVDGQYQTMIERIMSSNNPNFFFLQYSLLDYKVKNLIMIPKYFFSPDVIEKRKPLSEHARRAGWTGCNILVKKIPPEGRISIIKNEIETPMEDVISKVERTEFIKDYLLDSRGWILDILNCINQLQTDTFTLEQMYQFETDLSEKHPDNHHIKDKIRQQLQVLRDKGIIEFHGRGNYSKVSR